MLMSIMIQAAKHVNIFKQKKKLSVNYQIFRIFKVRDHSTKLVLVFSVHFPIIGK